MPVRGRQRRPRCDDTWQALARPEGKAAKVAVAQIPNSRHPGHRLSMQRVPGNRVDHLDGQRLADVEECDLCDPGAKVWHDHSDPNQPSIRKAPSAIPPAST